MNQSNKIDVLEMWPSPSVNLRYDKEGISLCRLGEEECLCF